MEGVAAAVAGAIRGTAAGDATPASTPAEPPFTREELRRISGELAGHFPLPVDESHLVLTEVDPQRVHAYWGLRAADVAAARTASGADGAPLVLRFREPVTPTGALGPRPPFYVQVAGLRSDAYVDIPGQGRSYVAELGLIGRDGSLAVLATSNEVELPRPESAAPAAPDAASMPAGAEAAVVTDPTIAAPERALEPVFPEAAPPAGPGVPHGGMPPPEALSVDGDAAWMEPQPVLCDYPAAREIVAADGAGEAVEPIGLPAWGDESATPPHGGGPAPWAGRVACSSSLVGRGAGDEVEVHVELHVHGRVRPGDSLRLFGEPVPVRPDGTFSYRRPLPEAVLVVPVEIDRADTAGEARPEG
ncbi:MAG: DUF4912 domain-containing protein [Gammaproteobacteria bacterium]|jgi:hypothetical protein|nr:DUF4912 domain-containing protein [Gammaproteobacteria bacterium]